MTGDQAWLRAEEAMHVLLCAGIPKYLGNNRGGKVLQNEYLAQAYEILQDQYPELSVRYVTDLTVKRLSVVPLFFLDGASVDAHAGGQDAIRKK